MPLKSSCWKDLQQPTSKEFLSFLLHAGYLSLATGETFDNNSSKRLKFVVPNLEIRSLIDSKLLIPFYEVILE